MDEQKVTELVLGPKVLNALSFVVGGATSNAVTLEILGVATAPLAVATAVVGYFTATTLGVLGSFGCSLYIQIHTNLLSIARYGFYSHYVAGCSS